MADLIQAASGSSTGTGSVTATLATPAVKNDLLVALVATNEVLGDSGFVTPAGYASAAPSDINNTIKLRGQIFYKLAAGGETGLTVALASGTGDMGLWLPELTGLATSSPEDVSAENSGSTSPATTGAISQPTRGSIAVGLVAIVNNNTLSGPTNGYTLRGTVVSGNATAANKVRLAFLYNLAPGATDTGLTQGGTARAFVGQLVAFKIRHYEYVVVDRGSMGLAGRAQSSFGRY